MAFVKWFTNLMFHEPKPKPRNIWVIDESKCLKENELKRLRAFCSRAKEKALANNKFTPIRNWFMVELGLYTGLRVSEMASLKHSNLFLDEGRSSLFIVGKGNKPRFVWMSSDFRQICRRYFKYKKKFGFNVEGDAFVLNNLSDEKISRRALQKFFKKILAEAGLPGRYHIHTLRHTYATFLLKASNYNYRFVQKQLGHASIQTTQVYAGVVESDARMAVDRMFKS